MLLITKKAAELSLFAYKSLSIENIETDTQVLVFDDHELLCRFVVFRGTSSGIDVFMDLKRIQRKVGKNNIHRGFCICVDSIWDKLEPYLNDRPAGFQIVFSGHSLGGALAQVAAVKYSHFSDVIVFGSPRVGDSSFCENLCAVTNKEAQLWVNLFDLVPRVPIFNYAVPDWSLRTFRSMPSVFSPIKSPHLMTTYIEGVYERIIR